MAKRPSAPLSDATRVRSETVGRAKAVGMFQGGFWFMSSIRKAFGSWRVGVMIPLGFSSGMPNPMIGSTLTAWLASEGVDKTTIGLFALVSLPYNLKFLWAPVMDRYVFFSAWGRRRAARDEPTSAERPTRSARARTAPWRRPQEGLFRRSYRGRWRAQDVGRRRHTRFHSRPALQVDCCAAGRVVACVGGRPRPM